VNDPQLERKLEERDKSAAAGEKGAKVSAAKSRMNRAMLEQRAQEVDPTVVKLGDASIASSFTARRTSIDCVLTVLRQGVCSLVTTIQVFKILALNCLLSAYIMSALYLRGLKHGDMQMTATGLVTAGLFFFLSQTKPLLKLSSQRPSSTVFTPSVLTSIIGQFAIHMSCLTAITYLCESYGIQDELISVDGKFRPNLINSAVYLLSSTMQINNFVINYRGHPFTQSIQDNTSLWRSILAVYAVLFIVCTEVFEPLNDLLQLATFPNPEFRTYIIGILALNFGLAWCVERLSQKLEG